MITGLDHVVLLVNDIGTAATAYQTLFGCAPAWQSAGDGADRVLAEGANGPTTPDADLVLEKRQDEIFLIPDILCNSGGVVVSYFEWVQDLQQLFWEEEEVTRREYHILDRAFDQMVMRSKADNIPHRTAAMAIGVEKVRAAKNTRGLFP